MVRSDWPTTRFGGGNLISKMASLTQAGPPVWWSARTEQGAGLGSSQFAPIPLRAHVLVHTHTLQIYTHTLGECGLLRAQTQLKESKQCSGQSKQTVMDQIYPPNLPDKLNIAVSRTVLYQREHSSSELRVIGTTAHRVDSYFLHQLQCITNLTLLCSPVNPQSG